MHAAVCVGVENAADQACGGSRMERVWRRRGYCGVNCLTVVPLEILRSFVCRVATRGASSHISHCVAANRTLRETRRPAPRKIPLRVFPDPRIITRATELGRRIYLPRYAHALQTKHHCYALLTLKDIKNVLLPSRRTESLDVTAKTVILAKRHLERVQRSASATTDPATLVKIGRYTIVVELRLHI